MKNVSWEPAEDTDLGGPAAVCDKLMNASVIYMNVLFDFLLSGEIFITVSNRRIICA